MSCLKKAVQEIAVTKKDLFRVKEVFFLSDNRPLSLTKLRCKDYYNLFQEGKLLRSLLPLNAGLASFLFLSLVGNTDSVQSINRRRTIFEENLVKIFSIEF